MNETEIRKGIFTILHRIAPEADLDQMGNTENLREALDIDSFDFLKVIIALHETFGVNIPESDYRHVTTLKGMIEYLNKAMPRTQT